MEIILFMHNDRENLTTVWQIEEVEFCERTGIHGGRTFDRPRLPVGPTYENRARWMADWLVRHGIMDKKSLLWHDRYGAVIRIILDRSVAINFVPSEDGEPLPVVTPASTVWPKAADGLPKTIKIGMLEHSTLVRSPA